MSLNKTRVIRLDEDIDSFLAEQDNASEFIRTLIVKFMNESTNLLLQKHELEQKLLKLQTQIKDVELQLQYVDAEIEEVKERKELRCDGYDESVDRLLYMDKVTMDAIEYQASLLDVTSAQYKEWLYLDGIYDKIISKIV